MLCFRLESLAPTEESLCWAHSAVGHDGSAREASPVPDKDSSVGAKAMEREDGFARRCSQNDSDLPDVLFADSGITRSRHLAIIKTKNRPPGAGGRRIRTVGRCGSVPQRQAYAQA